MKTSAPSARTRLIFFAKLFVTIVALWLALRKVDYAELVPVLGGMRPGWLAVSVVAYCGALSCNALRWSSLDASPGTPYIKYLYYVFVGSFLNLFSPSAALAEGVRTYAFGRRYGGIQRSFAAVLFGRICGFALQLALSVLFVIFFWESIRSLPLLAGAGLDRAWLAVAAGVAVALALTVFFFRRRLAPFLSALASYAMSPRFVAVTFGLSLLIQVLSLFSIYVLFLSVNADIRLWHVMVLPFIAQLLLLVPISVGGVGVKEYLSLALFAHFAGLPAEKVLAATLLGYIPQFVAALLGGLWMLSRRRTRRAGTAAGADVNTAD